MTPDQEHQGERGLGDQIARYRTAFISILAMVVIRAVRGWLHPLQRAPLAAGMGPSARQGIRNAQGRVPHRPGGHARAGPVGHDRRAPRSAKSQAFRSNEGRRARDDEHHAQVRALHLPRRHDAAASQDAAEGHDRRGRPRHPQRWARPQRLHMPQSQTAPDVNFEEFLAEPGRRNARLPTGADRRSWSRAEGKLRESIGNLQALRPDRAICTQDHSAVATASQEHRTCDPQLPVDNHRARGQGHRNLTSHRRLQRCLQDVCRTGPELPTHA